MLAASLASHAITVAIRSGGVQSEKSASGMALRLAGVSMVLGTTAHTRIPSAATSAWVVGTEVDFVAVNGHDWGDVTHYAQTFYGSPSAYAIEAEWGVSVRTDTAALEAL